MVLIPPHTQTAAAETHLTRKNNKNHSPPPCRDYTMYMELEGTLMNKVFVLIGVYVFKLH